ncbi:hypothetical protein R84B8_00371 [Treponema sp. R8-4-B8]
MSFLTTEWNWDTAKEVWQEEAREKARYELREEVRNEVREERDEEILKLFDQGLSGDEIKEWLRKK